MKRNLTYLLCAVMLLSLLSACGRNNNGTVTPTPSSDVIITNTPIATTTPDLTASPEPTTSPDMEPVTSPSDAPTTSPDASGSPKASA